MHAEDSQLDTLVSTRGNTVFAWVKNVGNSSVGKIAITVRGKRTYTKAFLIDEGLLPGKKRRFDFAVPASCQLSGAVEIWVSKVDGKTFPPPKPVDDLRLDAAALARRRAFEQLPDARVVAFQSGDMAVLQLGDEPCRVRLAGVSAPSFPRSLARDAKKAFQELALGKVLKVRIVGDSPPHKVAVVYRGTVNLNERLIRTGAVWYDPRTLESPEFCEAEKAARRLQLGVWLLPKSDQPAWKSLTSPCEKVEAASATGTQSVPDSQ